MRILVYKRTHIGDPSSDGLFGCYGCMGRVRSWHFDAVIGVGGIGAEPRSHGIDRRITWIGVGPLAIGTNKTDGYPIWGFEKFYHRDARGPLLADKAPRLTRQLFRRNPPRFLMLSRSEEIDAILRLARSAGPSDALLSSVDVTMRRCPPKTRKRC